MPIFRYFRSLFRSPSFCVLRRAAFLYHPVTSDVNPFPTRFCSVGAAAQAERTVPEKKFQPFAFLFAYLDSVASVHHDRHTSSAQSCIFIIRVFSLSINFFQMRLLWSLSHRPKFRHHKKTFFSC